MCWQALKRRQTSENLSRMLSWNLPKLKHCGQTWYFLRLEAGSFFLKTRISHMGGKVKHGLWFLLETSAAPGRSGRLPAR